MTVGVVSAAAKQLAQEVFKIMLLQKLTLASAALLAAGLIAWGASAALVSLQRGAFAEVGRETGSFHATEGRGRRSRSPDPLRPTHPGRSRLAGGYSGRMGGPSRVRRSTCPRRRLLPLAPVPVARVRDDRTGRPLPVPASRWAEFTTDNVKLRYEKTVVAAAAVGYGLAWVEVPPGAGATT